MRPLSLLLACFISVHALDDRVDCHPEPFATQAQCLQRACIWDTASTTIESPRCRFPASTGYQHESGFNPFRLVKSPLSPRNPYGIDISPITLHYEYFGSILRVKIGVDDRYEPPINVPRSSMDSDESLRFMRNNDSDIFTFTISRSSTGTDIWNTGIGGLLFADKFIQIATYLPSDRLYGFGEHVHQRLKHDLTRYTTWPMFSRDLGRDSLLPLDTGNGYGVHPFYICIENDAKAHGVLFLNSNAQEVTTGPAPHLVYRTIGGLLDIYFFPGPTPEDVVSQYLAIIGKPVLPPYWALGFQLSRYGYAGLEGMKEAINRTMTAGINLDVVYADIDYMDRDLDFTIGRDWTDFPAYVPELHQQNLRLVLIIDPPIAVDYEPFSRAMQQWPRASLVPHAVQDQYPLVQNTTIMLANVRPSSHVAFPDFLDPSNATRNWWRDELVRFHAVLPFDGIWLDMNEPSNLHTGVYNESGVPMKASPILVCPIGTVDGVLDNPPYATYAAYHYGPDSYLSNGTLCMLAKTAGGTMNFFDTKNLYGWSQTRTTAEALVVTTGKRTIIIARSTFPSSGRYGGSWLGDNLSTWADLRQSVIGTLEFNMFGIPYAGSDICGYRLPSGEELCLRWHQMGAFHPFSRNHNRREEPPQDPAMWPTVAAAAKKALAFRYTYLPYLYSLHFQASLNGHTVIRPLFFEFPTDANTHDINYQFLWGSALLITPVLNAGASTVRGYVPPGTWYSLYDFNYGRVQTSGFQDLSAPTTSLIPVHVRGGFILPRQAANMTTAVSRTNPFELLIAIGTCGFHFCAYTLAESGNWATGELFWDDGDSIVPEELESSNHYHWRFHYTSNSSVSQIAIQRIRSAANLTIPSLDIVEIFGLLTAPDFATFKLDGQTLPVDGTSSFYTASTRRLYLKTAKWIDLASTKTDQPSIVSWNAQA